MDSLLFLFFLILFNSFLVWIVFANVKLVTLNFVLMCVTPWAWTLILNAPTLWELSHVMPDELSISASVAQILSWDYLLFHGTPKLFYAVGEHGYFLISFLPLFIFGLWTLLGSNSAKQKSLAFLLLIGLGISIVFSKSVGLLSVFWFLPVLSIVGAVGLYKLIVIMTKTSSSLTFRLLILINILWILYETSRLFRVIQVQSTLQI